uniref:Uncharacterized protein n=1 Tax=Anguilla anguilla TaxID=7936 RepID=A0A0E9VMD3_ANGAN
MVHQAHLNLNYNRPFSLLKKKIHNLTL